jgi:hypothetical protein
LRDASKIYFEGARCLGARGEVIENERGVTIDLIGTVHCKFHLDVCGQRIETGSVYSLKRSSHIVASLLMAIFFHDGARFDSEITSKLVKLGWWCLRIGEFKYLKVMS